MTAILLDPPAISDQVSSVPRGPSVWRLIAYWTPLALILVVQAFQSGRLLSSPVSFDEARYIYAGHQLLDELTHGGGSPYYETYYSGAPVIFCPLAGLADSLGGLVAVRLLCLCFELTVTALLFATTRRLLSYPAAVAACALFASVKLTYFVGTYAAYDSMALLGLATGLYCASRAKDTRWLLIVPLALLAANATKYMTVLFDPVVLAVAALSAGTRFWRGLAILAAVTAAVDLIVLYLAGTAYLQGVMFSTLARKQGGSALLGATAKTAGQIITESRGWIGPVVVAAIAGLILAAFAPDRRRMLMLLGILTFAGILVTLEGIHLHSDESMNQHDDFSAMFAAIPAGYVVQRLLELARHIRHLDYCVAGLALLALVPAFIHGDPVRIYPLNGEQTTAAQLRLFAYSKPYLEVRDGNYLISGNTDYAMLYVDQLDLRWYRYDDDSYIKYPIPGRGGDINGTIRGPDCTRLRPGCMYLSGSAGYTAAIRHHFFAMITLVGRNLQNPALMLAQDAAIERAAQTTAGYRLLTRQGGAPTWIYVPDYTARSKSFAPTTPSSRIHRP